MSTLLDFNSRSKSQFLGLSQTPRLLAALYACTSILQKWLTVINVINATHAHKQWVFKLTFPEVDWSSLLKFYQQDSNSNARCRLVLTTRKPVHLHFRSRAVPNLAKSNSLSRCKRRYSELCCYFTPSWGSSSSVGTTRFVVFFYFLFYFLTTTVGIDAHCDSGASVSFRFSRQPTTSGGWTGEICAEKPAGCPHETGLTVLQACRWVCNVHLFSWHGLLLLVVVVLVLLTVVSAAARLFCSWASCVRAFPRVRWTRQSSRCVLCNWLKTRRVVIGPSYPTGNIWYNFVEY